MEKHAIGELMENTLSKIRELVDVNTVVGSPIQTPDGITLIPVSKVSFGFAAGGSDFQTKNGKDSQPNPFGGGSGAGVRIEPVSFLVIRDGSVRVLSANADNQSAAERVIEAVPDIIDKVREVLPKKKDEETDTED
ncbi:MAG: GerW family sporulation protein [Oscillospiraceae bacterium]|nr:GerW family sporulation protein [Oscillospiraceae bacterium]